MKHIVIAPFDGFIEPIFDGFKEFPTEKVILVTASKFVKKASQAKTELEKFKVPVEIFEINDDDSLEEVFEAFSHLSAREKGKDVIVNLGGAHGMLSCSSLSACFVNGLKAFEVANEKLVMFPVLKFSYYDMLSEKKLSLLSILFEKEKVSSLEELGRTANLGPSLVNYHVYGNEKNPGLKELGLVEINRVKGKVTIRLTTLGRLLLKQKQEK